MTRARTLASLAAAASVAIGVSVWLLLARLDPAATAERVEALGPIGPLVLLGVFVFQCIVAPVPSEPVMMAAGFAYGPRGGFALAWAGVVLGAAACFGLSRRLGRPFATRFVRPEHLDAVDGYVRARGTATAFLAILAIRVTAFGAFDVLSYACGLLPVRFVAFLLATAIGVVPKAFAFTYAGAYAAQRPPWLDVVIVAGTFGILVAAPWLALRFRRSRAS